MAAEQVATADMGANGGENAADELRRAADEAAATAVQGGDADLAESAADRMNAAAGVNPFATGTGNDVEDRISALERSASEGRGVFQTADRIIGQMQQALVRCMQVEMDTRSVVANMEAGYKAKTEYLNAEDQKNKGWIDATVAEVKNQKMVLEQTVQVVENIVGEVKHKRAGVDEIYVSAKVKLEELEVGMRNLGAHVEQMGGPAQNLGLNHNVEERIRK